jgi:hypothetical protein
MNALVCSQLLLLLLLLLMVVLLLFESDVLVVEGHVGVIFMTRL